MSIQVSETTAQASASTERERLGKPSHWVHAKPTEFQNPWPSWRNVNMKDVVEMLAKSLQEIGGSPPKDKIAQIPIQKPAWGAEMAKNPEKIKSTWLGHACFLLELPSSGAGVRGARILFDPVFSDRCSPSQHIGPKRFTPPPCALEEVPEIDVIVISHNHYDHMDTTSLTNLLARPSAPHVFAPIGNAAYFASLGVPVARTHCLDWWDARRVRAPVSPTQHVEFDLTFTPGQHFTGRGIFDRFKTLWGGWVVEGVAPDINAKDNANTNANAKPPLVYFAGDTGYRSVPSNSDNGPETLPVCPAFKEIGARWGGFDLALIPIGAYAPRRYMSKIHCAPRDSVALFRDVRARRAIGMHWGAWILTTEDIVEPPVLLAAECAKAGVEDGAFGVCAIGETVAVGVESA
ncbi:Metallo-hydrolase/oxidoreductase [Mycena epipterygia]|nr:Metallo-hydrolase/oxidoreductase [Mycena epipterygia]